MTAADGVLRLTFEAAEEGRSTIRVVSEESGGGLSAVLDRIIRSGGRVVDCNAEQVEFEEIFCSLVQAPAVPVTQGGSK